MEEQTLVLDVAMAPVRIVPWQEAIVWVFDRLVDVVDTYPRHIGTPNPRWAVEVPSIVRFLRPLPRRRVIKFSRSAVFARDRGRCQYCGRAVPRSEFTYDHVTPRSQGGRTCWENVAVACMPCNQRKGGRTPAAAGMHLLNSPVKPRHLPDFKASSIAWNRGMPDAWRDFLRSAVYWDGALEQDGP